MQIHELKIKNKSKKKKRIARGGKRGTYSGRGLKGQKSRAGRRMVPEIRGSIKRYPKLKGYKFKSFKNTAIINVGIFDKIFEASTEINPKILAENGLVKKIKGRVPKVKILSKGNLAKNFIFTGCFFSKNAEEKIKKAGGEIK